MRFFRKKQEEDDFEDGDEDSYEPIDPIGRKKPFQKRFSEWQQAQWEALRQRFAREEDDPDDGIVRSKSLQKRFSEWSQRQWERLHDGSIDCVEFLRAVRLRIPGWLFSSMLFFGGLAIGAVGVYVVMKQRRGASDTIVAVRGVPITQQNFFHRMETQVGGATLNQLVSEQLILQYVHEKHISLPYPEVQARAKQIMQQPGFQTAMTERHLTVPDVEQMARVALAKEALFGADVTVSEDEVKAYYRLQSDPNNPRAPYYFPESAHIAVIATFDEGQIRKAYRELLAGKPIADAAKTYSTDKSGANGGSVPPVLRGRSFLSSDPDLEKAVFALEPGEMTPPKKSGNHWYIILCHDQDPARTTPFAEVKEQCEREVKVIKAAKTNLTQVAADFAKFRKKANIQIFWEQYYYDLFGKPKQVSTSNP